MRVDENKLFSADSLRLNLMLASLYLTAFELLKSSIIEGVKDAFVFPGVISDDHGQDDWMARRFRERHLEEVQKYEREVGVSFKDRERLGLIPSCKWLFKQGVLTEDDIDEVKSIRDHRNEIAHELPTLLVVQNFDVNLQHFLQIRRLLHRVDVYWARNDLLTNPATLEEVDISDVPDDEIYSLRIVILDMITDAVVEYLDESGAEATNIH